MSNAFNWFKIFHIFFVIAWMVGIFYYPRILLQYRLAADNSEPLERLRIMARKLFVYMTIMAGLAIATGLTLWLYFGMSGGWMHAKLTLVLIMILHHVLCPVLMVRLATSPHATSIGTLKIFAHAPTLLLLLILILTIAKPF